jgi:hypothetical protein
MLGSASGLPSVLAISSACCHARQARARQSGASGVSPTARVLPRTVSASGEALRKPEDSGGVDLEYSGELVVIDLDDPHARVAQEVALARRPPLPMGLARCAAINSSCALSKAPSSSPSFRRRLPTFAAWPPEGSRSSKAWACELRATAQAYISWSVIRFLLTGSSCQVGNELRQRRKPGRILRRRLPCRALPGGRISLGADE